MLSLLENGKQVDHETKITTGKTESEKLKIKYLNSIEDLKPNSIVYLQHKQQSLIIQ